MKWLTTVFCFIGLSLMAQDPLKSAHQNLEKATTASDSIKAYQDLAWYSQRSAIDSSFIFNKKAQSIIDRIGDRDASNTNIKELAGYIYRSGDYQKAIDTYIKAKEKYRELNDSLNVAKIDANLGAVFQSYSQPEKAMTSYIDALSFFETDTRYREITAQTHGNIGVLYKSLGSLEEAISSYKQAESILDKGNNTIARSNVKLNLGGAHVQMEDYEKGKTYLEEALELIAGSNNLTTLAAVNHNLGTIDLKQGNYPRAQNYFEEALRLKLALGNMNEAATSIVSLSKTKVERGLYDDALVDLKTALSIFEENHDTERILETYPAISATFIYLKQSDSAFDYLERYTRLTGDKARKEALVISTDLDKKYNTEKKDRLLAEQETILLKNRLEAGKRRTMLWMLSLGLLATILFIFLLYRQQKLKTRQYEQEQRLKAAQATLHTQNRLQEQRLRISRDLHDNIGSQLTFLISSLDSLKYARNISADKINSKLADLSVFTRTTIGELRDTIWAMNKGNLSINDLRERLISHSSSASHTGIALQVEFKESVDMNYVFNAVDGMHIFRIIQEAVNNSYKHAQADQVRVRLDLTHNGDLVINVEDNGEGFIQDQDYQSNGLKNMRERAAALNSEIFIKSSPGEGTLVSLIVPI